MPAAHHVRDEGVAGSNPATPTKASPNKSMSFRTGTRPAKGALGQLLGQKRRPPPDPENESLRAQTGPRPDIAGRREFARPFRAITGRKRCATGEGGRRTPAASLKRRGFYLISNPPAAWLSREG